MDFPFQYSPAQREGVPYQPYNQDSLGREARVSVGGVGGHVEEELLGWVGAPALLHIAAVIVIPKVPVKITADRQKDS